MKEEDIAATSGRTASHQEKLLSLDNYFDVDSFTFTGPSLVDQVSVAANNMASSSGDNENNRDFLLGDMDFYFPEGGVVNEFSVNGCGNNNQNNPNKNNNDNDTSSVEDDEEYDLLGENAPAFPLSDSVEIDDGGNNDGIQEPVISNHNGSPSSWDNSNSDLLGMSSSATSGSVEMNLGIDLPLHRSWHNSVEDRPSRQAMILEIARLLKSRKKNQPTTEWLQQLPHKARKLEERLYRAAPSLSAYQDLSTLKNRLRKVAQFIEKQHTAAKTRHSFVTRNGSMASNASTGNARLTLRTSLTSQDAKSRDSFASQSSMNSMHSLNHQITGMSAVSAVPSQLDAPALKLSSANPQPMYLRSIPEDMLSSMGGVSGGISLGISSGRVGGVGTTAGQSSAATLQQQQQKQPANSLAASITNPNSKSLLEQQKAINEKLQREIQENIRKQNEWFKRMQESRAAAAAAVVAGPALGVSSNVQQQQAQLQRDSSTGSMGNNSTKGMGAGNCSMAPMGNSRMGMVGVGANNASSAMGTSSGNRGDIMCGSNNVKSNVQQLMAPQQAFPFSSQLAAATALMNNPNAPPATRLQAAQMRAALMQQQQHFQQQNQRQNNSMNGQNPISAAMPNTPFQQTQQKTQFALQQGMPGMQGPQQQFSQQQQQQGMPGMQSPLQQFSQQQQQQSMPGMQGPLQQFSQQQQQQQLLNKMMQQGLNNNHIGSSTMMQSNAPTAILPSATAPNSSPTPMGAMPPPLAIPKSKNLSSNKDIDDDDPPLSLGTFNWG